MHIYAHFQEKLRHHLQEKAQAQGLDLGQNLARVMVEPPRDPAHGCMATNAAMVVSKGFGMNPRALAEELKAFLEGLEGVANVEIAGPGFINLRLKPSFWQSQIPEILCKDADYGKLSPQKPLNVNVEYVSVNPTGPMHVGHSRVAVVGDVMSNLMEKAGHRVTREFYINDAGAQADKLAKSAYVRACQALGQDVSDPEDYPGDYLIPVGKVLAEKFGPDLLEGDFEAWLEKLRPVAIEAMMDLIKEDLQTLGIQHDLFTSERSLVEAGKVDEAVKSLTAKDFIYKGTLPRPKGAEDDPDWTPQERLLFRSTHFGDDIDRALTKEDDRWTYFASDIAYHYDKCQRGFDLLINVWGADHGGYIKRLEGAIEAIAGRKDAMKVILCNMVKFLKDGEPVTMSKRSGTFISVQDVVEEVGQDVVRLIMMTRRNDAPLDFDFKEVTEKTKDNPVFYIQYAHARAHSLLRAAKEAFPKVDFDLNALANVDFSTLQSEEELATLKILCQWPRQIEQAVEAFEPHRLVYALEEIAGAFHALWTAGKENTILRFIHPEDQARTQAKIGLVMAIACVIRSGLQVLGVQAVEEMR